MLRVVGGELGGRRLARPKTDSVRPTSNRVREALFDILAGRVVDALFVDGFAGSGAVGIEALSRGARSAVFVESGPTALACLRRNLRDLELESLGRVMPMSWAKAVETMQGEGLRSDLVFLDPPYRTDPHPLVAQLKQSGLIAPGGMMIVEISGRRELDAPWGEVRVRRYGDTALALIEH